MKVRVKAATLIVNDKRCAAIGVYCGSRWYRFSDWKHYISEFGLIRKIDGGFSIGPILIWDGK